MRVGVWDWMLKTAAWKDTRFSTGGKSIQLKRGQLCISQAQVTEATGMSRQQLRTFIKALENEGAVQTQPATNLTKGRTLITICKYDKYQDSNQAANQTATKQQPIKEQGNNIPVGAGDNSPTVDPAKIAFEQGRKVLMAAGKSHAASGQIIGKWRKAHSDGEIIEALGKAQREGAIDPVGFIEGVFRHQAKRAEAAEYSGAFGRIKEAC